jgi:hypothetical protein
MGNTLFKGRYLKVEEIPEAEVPLAKRRVSSFIEQVQEDWDRLTQDITERDRRGEGPLKVKLDPSLYKLKGIKHPDKVVVRKLKEYVRERNIARKIVWREGAVYVLPLGKKKKTEERG